MSKRLHPRLLRDLLLQGRIARYAGREAEARVNYTEVLEAARLAKDWSLESEALFGLGNTELLRDPFAARRLLTESVQLIESRVKAVRVANVKVHLALACLDSGDLAESRRLLEASLPVLEREEQEFALAFGTEVMGLLLSGEGRPTSALDQFRRAATLRRQPGGEEASPLRWRNRRDALIAELLKSAG